VSGLVNAARGEVLLTIDGAPRRLCLTLGALAELEAAFDALSLSALAERLGQLTANDLIVVLAALTAGGGEAVSAAGLAKASIDPAAAARAVSQAFERALGDE
jgi:hypothetical protein